MTFERQKVLFLVPSLAGGGAERVFSLLLRHLDRKQFELHLAALSAGGEYMDAIPADVIVHDLKISRVRYALAGIVRLAWKVRPHAILSTLGNMNIAVVLSKLLLPRRTRLLVREAAITSIALAEETRRPKLWAWLYRHLYKRADVVVCLSDSMVDDMAEHFKVPREKLARIYNPVDVERVRQVADAGQNPYSGPGPHLVGIGRLARQKGFDLLIAAMPAVLERLPNARLTILGQGPLRDELTGQAQRLGLADAVCFEGFQKNPWRYLRHADLFVLPSRYEGTSNVLLEALALGTPVVATDCPGGTREVQNFHGGIVLVPPEDVSALAEAIVSACRTPKPDAGRGQSASGFLSMFDVQQIVGEYSRLLSG